MPGRYELIDGRFSRGDQQAFDWAHKLTSVLGHNSRYDVFDLYRRTDWNDNRSRVRSDGSILLGARTAHWLETCGGRMFNAHYAGQYQPTREEAENVRQALDAFVTVYLEKVAPPDPAMTPALEALDRGLRANVVLPRIIEDSLVHRAFPQLRDLDDLHPLVQGATSTLTERLGNHLGMRPGELDDLLIRTPPAQRFDVLADAVIENDPLQRRLPDGSARTLPDDHVARLKASLVRELDDTFQRCHDRSSEPARGARSRGDDLGRQAVTNLLSRNAEARDEISTDRPGYQQVADVMAVVQTELSTGRAPISQGGASGTSVLQLKMKTDYWNGALHASGLPDGALGFAGTDRSLTFDREKVIDVLVTADPSRPPTPELRQAVDEVTAQATRLCNPVTPGTTPNDPADQALEDQLRSDFVGRQRTRVFTALGFDTDQLGDNAPRSTTATAQVVATLTESAGRRLGLEPHEITARLLTTPPSERIETVAALNLAEPGAVVDRAQLESARETLAGNLRTIIAKAAEADQSGQTKLHSWNRATAGERLSHQVTAAINKAGRPVSKTSVSGDEALLRSVAAATAGQPRAGSTLASSADPSTERGHQSGKGQPGKGVNGRG
ncbi:hypothetical protein ACIA58_01140 [Kribbella sp. NPDC051586]|uniref:hypothetical protein n=1 Tax=Kribbella sp. NPDC051586 TaxID=3364118 RepID=UPI003787B3ED